MTRDRAARALSGVMLLDARVYAAVAGTRTPVLDSVMRRLSQAANHSKLSIGCAALLALIGGSRGRRVAVDGLASVGATSVITNLAVKPLARRTRPDRTGARVALVRHVRMPRSSAFPSGHAASAFAFATAVGHDLPATAVPLQALAAAVAYSRVHTGVHHPSDTIAGALLGTVIARTTARALDSRLADHGPPDRGDAPTGPDGGGF
jgi:membrane-associated phospholipid phosphatase